VIILDVVEDGWWKGRVGNREGVFPSNFVEEIPEVNEPTPPPPAAAPTEQLPSTGVCVCVCVCARACMCVRVRACPGRFLCAHTITLGMVQPNLRGTSPLPGICQHWLIVPTV